MLMISLLILFILQFNGTNGEHLLNLTNLFNNDNKQWEHNILYNEYLKSSWCSIIPVNNIEYSENDEKDLLKDIQTSFVPSENIFISSDCLPRKKTIKIEILNDNVKLIGRHKRFLKLLNETQKVNSPTSSLFSQSSAHNHRININGRDIQHNLFKETGRSGEIIRITQAINMKKYMDMKIDPCTDFYQYACGNWVKHNPIPKDKAGYDTFEMLRENLDMVLLELLTDKDISTSNNNNNNNKFRSKKLSIKKRAALLQILEKHKNLKVERKRRHNYEPEIQLKKNNKISAELKAKNLFESCMNSEILEKRGISPLLELLKKFGGWPVLDNNWTNQHFNWLNLTAILRLYNNDIFIVQWVGPDLKNSDENVIQLDQTSLGLPTREFFLNKSNMIYLNAYKEFMITIMSLLGANNENAKKTATKLIEFEIQLAEITTSSEERLNISMIYNRLTIFDLQQQTPEINWITYLSIVQQRNVDENETVVNFAIDYFKNLANLIQNTESKIIANYLLWRFVRHRVNNLDDRFLESKQKFFYVLFGREQSPPRWKNCVTQVNENLGMALGAMFVRKYFDENSKKDTLKMTLDLQESFKEILNGTDWIDETTKRLAKLKVNTMSFKIGYPDFILSAESLDEKYENLEITPNQYFENTLNVLKHVSMVEQLKLQKPVNKTVWQTAPAIVNAYYSRNKNQIMFPAGILQPPFFHRHFPRALNYGGIGVVIGHELTHGFDDKGRLFDENGNVHKWWSDYATNEFHRRSACIISQYGNYTLPEIGMNVDGESTQGENIADNGGIKQAFHAYKNWLKRHRFSGTEQSEKMPGLDLTEKQLFFLNFAQVWCGAMRPEAMRSKIKTAVHSPGKFRVIGTLSNSYDFAKEFQCPVGTPMNPKNKCTIW